MEQLILQLFKDSIFAGFLGVVLFYILRQLDRKLCEVSEIGLVNNIMITQLTRSFEAHDITVTGINPSVDLTDVDDDRVRMVLAKYHSIDERLSAVEKEAIAALQRIRDGKK